MEFTKEGREAYHKQVLEHYGDINSWKTDHLRHCNILIHLMIKEWEYEDDLYDFAGQKVIKFIRNLPNEISNIMLFGHNYAFTSLVNALGNKYIDNLPTTGLVLIEFDSDSWKDLSKGNSKLIIFPKALR